MTGSVQRRRWKRPRPIEVETRAADVIAIVALLSFCCLFAHLESEKLPKIMPQWGSLEVKNCFAYRNEGPYHIISYIILFILI